MLLALFVSLFGGAYAWPAAQPEIDRPLLTLATFRKAGAFVVVFGCWCFGAADPRSVPAMSGDLAFAALFAWWLIGSPPQESR